MGSEFKLTRIAIFYDGNYFSKVNNFYMNDSDEEKKNSINIKGLHEQVKRTVAKTEHVEESACQIVEAHYFRGYFSNASDDAAWRSFTNVLINLGVSLHLFPIDEKYPKEKGVDVAFAIEALELTILKKIDIAVFVACDADYVPLVRKINSYGVRAMLVSWEGKTEQTETKTSWKLKEACNYEINLKEEIKKNLSLLYHKDNKLSLEPVSG